MRSSIAMSLYPVIDTSAPIPRPRSRIARYAPRAMRSLAVTMAVRSGRRSSRREAARYPGSTWYHDASSTAESSTSSSRVCIQDMNA